MTGPNQPGAENGENTRKIRILVVCAWPLGGIRTYLKYNYRHFPKDQFDITVLAIPTLEAESFERDLKVEDIPVIWSPPRLGRNILFARVARLLRSRRFDCLHSQGFTAAFHVAAANRLRRLPHVLTMHGIVEPRYFRGWSAPLKRLFFRRMLENVTVFHAVGDDMLDHLKQELPKLRSRAARFVVIRNGIDVDRFSSEAPSARVELRKTMGCGEGTFVFGYFGRFMPEKGFDCLIKAIEILKKQHGASPDFRVLAMGSGDYEDWVRKLVARSGLSDTFVFRPFTAEVEDYIKGCDAVVVPSRHEAYPLLPCEALVAGVPVIASNAMGLREAVRDTPALVFPVDDIDALASAMRTALTDRSIKKRFTDFRLTAADRYDVRHSAEQMAALLRELAARP